MRRVLLINYYFPPLGGVGPHRWLRLLPHLESLGWEPSVLTTSEGLPGELRDEGLLKKVSPGLTVHRTPLWNLQKPLPWIQRVGGKRLAGAFDRLVEFPPPDRHLGWYPNALRKAKDILKAQPADVVVTVSTPYTAHLVGWMLKRTFPHRWVVDLRDEWSNNPGRQPLFSFQARLDRWLESRVFRGADKILMTTPSYAKSLIQRLPTADQSKVMVLTNGFDRRDFDTPPRRYASRRFHIVHTGSLYGAQNPAHFLQALKNAIDKGSIPRDAIQATFVGRASFAIEQGDFAPWLGSGVVQRIPFASHETSLRIMREEADLLLILFGRGKGEGNIPSKTFEYLAAQKPILALVPPLGDTAQMLEEAKAGFVVDPEDVARIEETLVGLFQRWAKGTLEADPDPEQVNRYESRALAERFAGCLDELVEGRPRLPQAAEREGVPA